MSGDQVKLLETLLACAAWQKFYLGRKAELTFEDACRFWGVTESTPREVIIGRISRLHSDLAGIEQSIGFDGEILVNGRSVSYEDIATILDASAFLEGRFARHINRLRGQG
jgi:hypothetical protein